MIIAIDGPAGAGKSTVAKILAKELGFLYIDTGAMYRALTLKAIENKIDINDFPRLIEMAAKTSIDLKNNPDGSLQVFLDGRDVSRQIREPRITKWVSEIARIKEVREVMLGIQRRLGQQGDSVLDGRDIGTVVFPDADKKFYIDADFSERVRKFGYKVMYYPKTCMWHKVSASTGGSGSPTNDYFLTRNRVYFAMRYLSFRTKFAVLRDTIRLIFIGRTWQKWGAFDALFGVKGMGAWKKR